MEQQIYEAIEAMIARFTHIPIEYVIRGYPVNRPAPPKTDTYAVMTLGNSKSDSTPVTSWTENSFTAQRDQQAPVQIDFYGENAKENADTIVNLSRTPILCDFLARFNVTPLYCDDLRNLTGVSLEKRYVPRWTVDFWISFKTATTAPIDTFETVELNNIKTEF